MTEIIPDITSLILYRDAMMLVLNKPSGVPVHAGSGKFTPIDVHFEELRFGLPQKPELAHRLDKDTSGCLVLGRHRQALKRLGHLFESGQAEKVYHAVVHGKMPGEEGVIDFPLAPQSKHKTRWWMKVDPAGKPALTHYKVLGSNDQHSYLELRPKTGRTHQLRVHCAAVGCPILGDKIYGVSDGVSTLHLHAYSITLPLYPKKDPITVTAPVPEYMNSYYLVSVL